MLKAEVDGVPVAIVQLGVILGNNARLELRLARFEFVREGLLQRLLGDWSAGARASNIEASGKRSDNAFPITYLKSSINITKPIHLRLRLFDGVFDRHLPSIERQFRSGGATCASELLRLN